MLSYPVRVADTADGKVRVTFFDVPEAIAEAGNEEDALYQAKFALELSLGNYVLHERPIPAPSEHPDAPTISTDKFNLPKQEDPPVEPAEAALDVDSAPGGGRY